MMYCTMNFHWLYTDTMTVTLLLPMDSSDIDNASIHLQVVDNHDMARRAEHFDHTEMYNIK